MYLKDIKYFLFTLENIIKRMTILLFRYLIFFIVYLSIDY